MDIEAIKAMVERASAAPREIDAMVGPKQTVTVRLNPRCRATIANVRRGSETDAAVIRRILETISPISRDFDHFFGTGEQQQ